MNHSAVDAELVAAGGLQIERDGAILTVWLSRPDSRNSQTPQMWRALAHVAQTIPPEIDVVFIRGRGQAFSSGLDRAMFTDGLPGEPSLASMAEMTTEEFSAKVDGYQQAFTLWRAIDAVVVAAVHGYAIGAGFQLALGADFIISTDDARFSMREVQLGLVPDLAGTSPLVDAVGYAKAVEICATGRDISATEGVDLGFVARIADASEFDGLVAEVGGQISSSPARAALAVKAVLRGASLRDPDAQREQERRAQHGRVVKLAAMFSNQQ